MISLYIVLHISVNSVLFDLSVRLMIDAPCLLIEEQTNRHINPELSCQHFLFPPFFQLLNLYTTEIVRLDFTLSGESFQQLRKSGVVQC